MKYAKILVPVLSMALFTTPALAEAAKGSAKPAASKAETVQDAGETGKKCAHVKEDLAARHAAHSGDTNDFQGDQADTNPHHHNKKR